MTKPYSRQEPRVRDDRNRLLTTNQRDSLVWLLQHHPEPAALHKATARLLLERRYVEPHESRQCYILSPSGLKLATRVAAEVAEYQTGPTTGSAPAAASLEATNLLQLARIFELEAQNSGLQNEVAKLRGVVKNLLQCERLHLDSIGLFVARIALND